MATKSLKRTIIEGGRTSYNKDERRQQHGIERAHERDFLRECERDPAAWDDGVDVRGRSRVGDRIEKSFKDCLNPLTRFLEKKVGHEWNNIYAELKERYDERTTKGYHLLNDHIRGAIEGIGENGRPIDLNEAWYRRYRFFYVDERGILRKHKMSARQKTERLTDEDYNKIIAFLDKRKVLRNGGIICWVEPCNPAEAIKCFFGPQKTETRPGLFRANYYQHQYEVGLNWVYYVKDRWVPERVDFWGRTRPGHFGLRKVGASRFRAGKELTSTEMAAWNKFSELARETMLKRSGWTKGRLDSVCATDFK